MNSATTETAPVATKKKSPAKKKSVATKNAVATKPAKKKSVAKKPTASKPGKAHRYQLHGFPIVQVLRRLGAEGFGYKEAEKALKAKGVKCKEATIRINTAIGRRGGEGAQAPLTKDQLSELQDLGKIVQDASSEAGK